jgi:HAMP domain-containing protein
MKMTIRSKLVLAISILMVIVFSIASYLFINEKKTELAQDIYINSLAFSRLTAPTIAYNYDLYMEQNSFVYFNREISSVFAQNDDIKNIKVFSYDGRVLYDSELDVEAKYVGEERFVNEDLMDYIQSRNVGVKLKDGRDVFVKIGVDEEVYFVDKNEHRIDRVEDGAFVEYFVVPATEKYSLYYGIDYTNLEIRVARMRVRIIYLAIFGVMLGVFMSIFMAKRVTRPVSELVEGAEHIAKGDFDYRVDIKTNDELSFLGSAFNKMAVDLKAGLKARLYEERKTTELQLATKIQEELIPKEVPGIEGLDMAASIVPAGEIGGDIYDFLPVGDKKMLIYLGDVTGHGIPAGIVSSIANSLLFGYASKGDLKVILSEVNRVMKAKTMTTMFMTLCLVSWDAEQKKLTYSSAGHEQLIHYSARKNSTDLAPAGGMALGMIEDISGVLQVNEVDFQSGDFLILYSDGIPETWKNEQESYGMDRLRHVVEKFASKSTAEELKSIILSDLEQFRGDHEQMDDVTIVVIKRV